MAETFTPDLALSMFAQGERFPVISAAKLNANWTKADLAAVGKGSAFPATFGVGKLFVKTGGVGRGQIFQNTGTFSVPVWTAVIDLSTLGISDIGGLQAALDLKASITYVDAQITSHGFDAFDKAFFTHNGFMPANTILEAPMDFPAPDFANLSGATPSRSMTRYSLPAGGGNQNFGWNLGASYGKVLMIMGGMRALSSNAGIALFPTLPIAGDPIDGYLIVNEPTAPGITVYKRSGGSYTVLLHQTILGTANDRFAPTLAMAVHVNGATGRIVCFIKYGAERWFPVIDFTDATFASFHYAGIFGALSGGNTDWFVVPMGIWAE